MDWVSGFLVFLVVVAIIVVVVIARTVRTVPQGYNWTVERFGRYRVTLLPGLRIINPQFRSWFRRQQLSVSAAFRLNKVRTLGGS